uniref:Uncharacterized protein n=1 Tax=Parascaris equorum TaxID=6256 RepID=A0A914R8M6_PAREQ
MIDSETLWATVDAEAQRQQRALKAPLQLADRHHQPTVASEKDAYPILCLSCIAAQFFTNSLPTGLTKFA